MIASMSCLEKKCAHSTLPVTILYAYIFFFLIRKVYFFSFIELSFPCIELNNNFGEGFFVASSCGEADPLVKYLWDFLSATVFAAV